MFTDILQPEHARRATRVLQAVWEGHGGSPASFPAPSPLTGPLTHEDVELLLGTLDTEDMTVWRRVGRDFTLEFVTALKVEDPSRNLQRLVTANVDRLSARAVRILTEPLRLDEPDYARWLIVNKCLVLRDGTWAAYFAADVPALPEVQGRQGVALRVLRERARARDLTVAGVEVEKPDVEISFRSKVRANVVDLEDLADLEARGGAVVHSAEVVLSQTKQVPCDFTTGTAGGHTRAIHIVSELGRVGLALLTDLDGERWATVEHLLTVPHTDPDEHEQPELYGLFDIDQHNPSESS